MFENKWTKRILAVGLGALLVLVGMGLASLGTDDDSQAADAAAASNVDPTQTADDADDVSPTDDTNEASTSAGGDTVVVVSPEPGDSGPAPQGPSGGNAPPTTQPAPPTTQPAPPAEPNEPPVADFVSITRHGYMVKVRGIVEDPDGEISHFTVDWGDGSPVETLAPYHNEGYDAPGIKADRNYGLEAADTTVEVVVTVYDDDGASITASETISF